jgi:hypothetical protein
MTTGFKFNYNSTTVDFSDVFLPYTSGTAQTTNYIAQDGNDLGTIFEPGANTITTGYKNQTGTDLGTLFVSFSQVPPFTITGVQGTDYDFVYVSGVYTILIYNNVTVTWTQSITNINGVTLYMVSGGGGGGGGNASFNSGGGTGGVPAKCIFLPSATNSYDFVIGTGGLGGYQPGNSSNVFGLNGTLTSCTAYNSDYVICNPGIGGDERGGLTVTPQYIINGTTITLLEPGTTVPIDPYQSNGGNPTPNISNGNSCYSYFIGLTIPGYSTTSFGGGGGGAGKPSDSTKGGGGGAGTGGLAGSSTNANGLNGSSRLYGCGGGGAANSTPNSTGGNGSKGFAYLYFTYP